MILVQWVVPTGIDLIYRQNFRNGIVIPNYFARITIPPELLFCILGAYGARVGNGVGTAGGIEPEGVGAAIVGSGNRYGELLGTNIT